MAIVPPIVTCSTCDDYQWVPISDDDPGGPLERCPDCLYRTAVRCLAHGRSLRDGKCPECKYQAAAAEEAIVLRSGKVDDPIAEAIFSS